MKNSNNKRRRIVILVLVVLFIILFVLIAKVMNRNVLDTNIGKEKEVSNSNETESMDVEEITKECKNAYTTYVKYYSAYISLNDISYSTNFKFIDDDSKIKADEYTSFYVKTSLAYEDFHSNMLKVFSNKFYDERIKPYTKNVDGTLYLIPGGGFSSEYQDILRFELKTANNDYSEVIYDAKVEKRFDDGAPHKILEGTVCFVKQDGKYVVDEIKLDEAV